MKMPRLPENEWRDKMAEGMNMELQYYKGIPIRLIARKYTNMQAKRFTINETNQNVWIPNKHLEPNGTIKQGEDLDYIFRYAWRQLNIAGIKQAIPGIKRSEENKLNKHNHQFS